MLLRKNSGLKQSELGKRIGTSGDIIGRYERGVITPSIEVIIKIADELNVSIDYLVGKTNFKLDQKTLKRFEEINNLTPEKRNYVFELIDILLRDFKARQAYAL